VIEFEDVSFSYGDRTILRNVSLSVEPASFTFLVGPAGSGKSTFLRLCYHDIRPTAGTVRQCGRQFRPADRNGIADLRRSIGVVHQECCFLDHLSILENIALPLMVSGIDMAERTEDLDALLEWIDLTDRAGALPPQMSGGERRRAAVARAVILSPDIILADEPTGNVDWDMAVRILTMFIELNRIGKTIFIATHDLGLVRAAQQRIQARVFGLEGYRLVPLGDVS
jgi:cell division transport system ATP-binding protein